MWKRVIAIAHRLGFTQNEAAVIVFLSVVIVAGSVLSELHPTGATPRRDVRNAYVDADSAFARRARQSAVAPDPAPGITGDREAANAEQAPVAETGPGTVALNTATARELTALPGIGPATAKKIISYREQYGPFRLPEDLMKVNGIGRKKFERIRQFITVE